MRLSQRRRRALVAEEIAEIAERGARDGELPIEDCSYRPSPGDASQQQVAFVEIAVDEMRLVVQRGKLRCARRYFK